LASGNNNQSEIKKISNINFIGKHLNDLPAKDLKGLADEFRSQIGSGVVALTSLHENKVSIVVSVTDDLTDEISAVDLVKLGANIVDGKGGGGRVDMAQAGGPNSAKVGEVIESIENELMLKT
jgi:alanyl-tRNA synthetase